MIRTPTTFVIGAGAIKPYGVPLASEIKEEIGGLKPRSDLYRLLLSSGIDPYDLNESIDDVRGFPLPSFDAYLEMREHDEKKIAVGKALLAAVMGRAIAHASGRAEIEQDWIAYVVRQMLEGASTGHAFAEGNSRVTFITFNFTWILEARIRELLKRAYGNPDDADAAMARIRILHMHGRLPELHALATSVIVDPRVGKVHQGWCQWLRDAAATIRVPSSAIPAATLAEARAAVSQASVLCFLGFGYHAHNLAQLDIPASLPGGEQTGIFGSAYGCFPGEQDCIKDRFLNRIVLGEREMGCLDVLRHFHVFHDRAEYQPPDRPPEGGVLSTYCVESLYLAQLLASTFA